ncbi:antiviral reverse transcriptase Drt2, partial [Vampirovibrio chlorellavorus]|uniref:antiviral reverse transcriptase Drt2 n=1 Tax=Vampirovibrio chlorellavorus TaxID=758823 RepID=UPI0026F12BAD
MTRDLCSSGSAGKGIVEQTWYRKKNYPHFDTALPYKVAHDYVTNPDNIRQHAFFPFLSFEQKIRRFKKKPKTRPIKFASHRDGYIFSYYAHLLTQPYEDLLKSANLDKVVLAYRSGIGNNITFAKEAFDQIERLGNCVAIGFDITGFFDSLDHTELKKKWATLLGKTSLPSDHYKVYRAITKYAHVDLVKCQERLKLTRKQKKEKRPICSTTEFRTLIRTEANNEASLIQVNPLNTGIPQGSSISALLANVYMYVFDKTMHQLAETLGGVYYRYSDDIFWACPIEHEALIKDEVKKHILKLGPQFQIQDEKTITTHFEKDESGLLKIRSGDKPFQYLGFLFDGQRRLMRSQTLSRFWRKFSFSVQKARKDALSSITKQRNPKLFKRKLYKKYTHLGSTNFLSYAKRAAITMNGEKGEWKKEPCWKQIKKHWQKVQSENSYGNFLKAEHGAAQLPEGLPILPAIVVADFKLSEFAQP